jgi:hypothetical protein
MLIREIRDSQKDSRSYGSFFLICSFINHHPDAIVAAPSLSSPKKICIYVPIRYYELQG